MSVVASQITGVSIAFSTFCSGADQRKHQSKLRATGLCVWNSPVTDDFPAQRASKAENGSIWWRHHDLLLIRTRLYVFAGTHQSDELLKKRLQWCDMSAMYCTSTYRQFDCMMSPKLIIRKCFHVMKSSWVTDHCSNVLRQQKYPILSLLRPSWPRGHDIIGVFC